MIMAWSESEVNICSTCETDLWAFGGTRDDFQIQLYTTVMEITTCCNCILGEGIMAEWYLVHKHKKRGLYSDDLLHFSVPAHDHAQLTSRAVLEDAFSHTVGV